MLVAEFPAITSPVQMPPFVRVSLSSREFLRAKVLPQRCAEESIVEKISLVREIRTQLNLSIRKAFHRQFDWGGHARKIIQKRQISIFGSRSRVLQQTLLTSGFVAMLTGNVEHSQISREAKSKEVSQPTIRRLFPPRLCRFHTTLQRSFWLILGGQYSLFSGG